MGLENLLRRLGRPTAQVAGVAEVSGGESRSKGDHALRGSQRSCRGPARTSASPSDHHVKAYEDNAEVAGVSDSFTHTRARARTRAGEQRVDTGPLQTPQPLRAPGAVTLLKHCRCMDCRSPISAARASSGPRASDTATRRRTPGTTARTTTAHRSARTCGLGLGAAVQRLQGSRVLPAVRAKTTMAGTVARHLFFVRQRLSKARRHGSHEDRAMGHRQGQTL